MSIELQGLEKVMARLVVLKGIPMAKAVRNAARDFVQEAQKSTPLSKPKTIWRQVPGRGTKTGSKIWIASKNSGKTNVSGSPKWQSMRTIRGRGFAKASWISAAQRLGMSTSGRVRVMRGALGKSTVLLDLDESKANPSVQIFDTLDYIAKLDAQHNLSGRGISKARERVVNEIGRMIARASSGAKA